MEEPLLISAQSLLPEDEQFDLTAWTQQEEIAPVLKAINKSIRTMHGITRATHIDVDFPWIAPHLDKPSIENIMHYLRVKGYTLSPIVDYHTREGIRSPVILVRVSWQDHYFPN